ncbi:MAG: PEGA domain-containing protein, partial [Calditrichae bacterium]|nr:PEGA domain-containing protein [Calditrichia bacterium]
MKLHIIVCLGIFLAFSIIGMARDTGMVSITSEPSNSWVRIDSILVGRTPISKFKLNTGLHQIQVYPPQNGIWNLEKRIYELSIKPKQDTSLHAVFGKPVLVNSIPYGAQLFSDTTQFGFTPLYIPFAVHKGKQFRIEKEGFKSYRFSLDSDKPVLAHLTKREEFIKNKPDSKFLGFISKKHLKSKFTLLALTVATHWA